MDGCPQVVSLAQALLALWRANASGVLHITAGGKQCSIALTHGAARAATASGDSALLGDWLLRRGELDLNAHAAALREGPPGPLVGSWLIERSVATRSAVERALSDQLRARILAVFRWRDLKFQFEQAQTQIGASGPERPIPLGEIAVAAARAAFDEAAFDRLLREQAERRMVPSAFGRALLDDPATFTCDALPELLRRAASLEQLAKACENSDADLKTLGALCWLAALVPAADGSSSYGLLLRKQVQLRRQASAAELLEVDRNARHGASRKALRRLARHVHPDALGPTAPPLLRAVSGELMQALVQAEQQLRGR
jgi:hypothetical protein